MSETNQLDNLQLNQIEQQALALSGIIYSAHCVDTLAHKGQISSVDTSPLIHSLFQFSPDSTQAVYGKLENMRPALKMLIDLLSGTLTNDHPDTVRYTLGIAVLERKSASRSDLLSIIHSRLEHLQYKYDHLDASPYELSKSISGIYQDTLSTLRFRIQVTGDARRLQDDNVADQVRSYLLCGFRSAMLWQQLGGRRWHLITRRKKLISSAQTLLDKMPL